MRRQIRAVGMLHALAPLMDVARDARWGRVTETYGEDPYLVGAMSVAFTRGMHGKDLREGVLVCAKHFLGYGATEGGQNMAATAIGPRALYDVYARPFEAAIRSTGLAGVMASYSEFEGVPIHVSRAVLTNLLRDRMGFAGTVVSDYNGIGWAQTRQLVASTPADIGALALSAGMDVELPGVPDTGRFWSKPSRMARSPSLSWTTPYVASCATRSSSAYLRTPTSARSQSRSRKWRARASISPDDSQPSR